MTRESSVRELTAEQCTVLFNEKSQTFTTTAELTPLEEIVGQPRAVKALEIGLGIEDSGYNIYAASDDGLGIKTMLTDILREKASRRSTPSDWIYVNNFDQQDHPLALALSPGKARQFKRDIHELISYFKEHLPREFQREDFRNDSTVKSSR